jgi:hypothetical protein
MPNQFLLPDELGWECNDILSDMLLEYALKATTVCLENTEKNYMSAMLRVVTAEYMDNMYAVILKYQKDKSYA